MRMLPKIFKATHNDFVVIDSQFPQKEPFAFRNTEINQYFDRIRNFHSYTMFPMASSPEVSSIDCLGITRNEFIANKKGYLRYYPQNKKRMHYLEKQKKYSFMLAYSFFLAETYTLLPFYENNKIPFVFVLYPGGRFALNTKESDEMLYKIFRSEYFRGVIVTQQITKDYLLKKRLCPTAKINYIYGGFVQFQKEEVLQKKHYKSHKQTFDICFVAAKYTEKGVDKGYDLFIEFAKKLCQKTDDIMFHVVGGFDQRDIDISDIKTRIKFYGYQKPSFLKEFYSTKDIFFGANRPFKILPGSFDGFPLGIDASYCGVALFVADELKMNRYYINNEDIVIVPLDPDKIADKVLYHYNNLDSLYELSERGKEKTQKLFDIDHQIDERIKFFSKFVKLDFKG